MLQNECQYTLKKFPTPPWLCFNSRVIRRSRVMPPMSKWCRLEADDVAPEFPRYSKEDLRCLTVRVYQLKLAPQYTHDHLNDRNYVIYISNDVTGVIGANVQSRHSSSKQYRCWVEYAEGTNLVWYCQCKAGSRVVGMCAHAVSVFWYMCIQRHQSTPASGVRNWGDCVSDARL